MEQVRQKITLDRLICYKIKVPGHLDEGWTEWNGKLKVEIALQKDGQPVTILTGTFDQAGLQGLLRRLYSLGLPLISVVCEEFEPEDQCSQQGEYYES
jgi:hypothetical protein